MRVLSSGVIEHGSQYTDPERGRRATAYYGPESGAAQAIRALADRPLRVALIGLGTGALAVYARPGDVYRFYELNPAVIDLARTQFRYLSESAGKVEVVAGDGRRELSRAPGAWFDMVILDAFSGDSIPAHLLTREAFAIYFGRLKRDGVLAVHITNRYVNLEGVVRGPAEETGRRVLVMDSPADPPNGAHAATWMVVTGNREVLARLDDTARRPKAPARIWTDDFSNLFGVLR
jgi:spermidine synthase